MCFTLVCLIYTRSSSSSSSSSSWPHPPPFNDGRFNEDKALPRKIHDRFPYISTSLLLLPLPFRVFRVPPSSGSRNEILRYRAACRWDGDKYRRRVDEEGKKERKRGREKAAAFRLMLPLSPSLPLSPLLRMDRRHRVIPPRIGGRIYRMRVHDRRKTLVAGAKRKDREHAFEMPTAVFMPR